MDLFAEIKKLNFPTEDYVVIGGARWARTQGNKRH